MSASNDELGIIFDPRCVLGKDATELHFNMMVKLVDATVPLSLYTPAMTALMQESGVTDMKQLLHRPIVVRRLDFNTNELQFISGVRL